ncbi:MAG: aminotransferase class IV [Lentisphaeria bacterium]|jgi:branched-subunit amino acid aminotransferase/4-amino-4-deoxychorismate lyase|nr:aminotransferase class IV [Lentisphaeria bacterium]MDP7740111.1 aminotransferase class IV [Lentisphaeria bacterium]
MPDQPTAYLNGEFVHADDCKLPMFDLGIVIGAAVTDLVRTFNGKPYRLEDHIRRFYRSCKYACIEPPASLEESMKITEELVERNQPVYDNRELAVVYYMTAGVNSAYAGAAAGADRLTPTYVQHTFPLLFHAWSHFFTDGAHCVTPPVRHVPPQVLSSKIKHRNRLHMWIGDKQAQQADPKAVPLYMDVDGNIAEASGSNFLIYRDGTVVSPRRPNMLWGISLQTVTEILAELDVPFIEEDIQTYDVVNADEAWLPSSPYCLAPVSRLNGTEIGSGKPGPMWRRILDHWSGLVGKDVYKEITEAPVP